jgi:sulfur-oxidizing protein SoxA
MQADDLSNPGFLWVESGEKLWNTPAGAANQELRVVPRRCPLVDARHRCAISQARRDRKRRAGPGRAHHACRVRKQEATPLARESDDLLSLAAWWRSSPAVFH